MCKHSERPQGSRIGMTRVGKAVSMNAEIKKHTSVNNTTVFLLTEGERGKCEGIHFYAPIYTLIMQFIIIKAMKYIH